MEKESKRDGKQIERLRKKEIVNEKEKEKEKRKLQRDKEGREGGGRR